MIENTERTQTTEAADETTSRPETTETAEIAYPVPKLSSKTKLNSVALFACGYGASIVADLLLEQPPRELKNAVDTVPPEILRRDILSQLRSCNPADSKFASTKYAEHYFETRTAVRTALIGKSHQIAENQLAHLENIKNDAIALSAQLRNMLSDASDITITGNPEFTKTANVLLATQKTLLAAGEQQLNLLEKLTSADELQRLEGEFRLARHARHKKEDGY